MIAGLESRLDLAARGLKDSGQPIAADLLEELDRYQSAFSEVCRRVRQVAASRGLADALTEDPTLEDLEVLVRRLNFADLELLDRVGELVRFDAPLPALDECIRMARELRQLLAGSGGARSPLTLKLIAAYRGLLGMVEEPEALGDREWLSLVQELEEAFGSSLAVAAARGQLMIMAEAKAAPAPAGQKEREAEIVPSSHHPPAAGQGLVLWSPDGTRQLKAVVVQAHAEGLELRSYIPDVHSYFEEGGRVLLRYGTASGLHCVGGEISEVTDGRLRVSLEGEETMVQRRRFLRFPMEIPFHFVVTSSAQSGVTIGEVHEGASINISAGGMFFKTSVALAAGDDLRVSVPLTPSLTIKTHALVVRSERSAEGSRQRVGLEFTGLEPTLQDDIQRVLSDRYMLEHPADWLSV